MARVPRLPSGFAMTAIAGDVMAIDMPTRGDQKLRALADLGKASLLITEELHARYGAKAETREWVQGVAYQLIGMMISNGFADLFKERIENFGRRLQVSGDHANPFFAGLLAISAHDKGAIDDKSRSYFAPRLWYAYRHYVPHQFLRGFLHQVWTEGATQKVGANDIEPDFESWVMIERARDPAPQLRGSYPVAFEEKVQQIRNVLRTLPRDQYYPGEL